VRAALIGYTGFVGSNLDTQYEFSDKYNSKNFHDMEGQQYDLVVCAGVSAVKWMANKEPEQDLENITSLKAVLKTISASRFVLISTIDVYPIIEKIDEDFDCHSIENHPYGLHRLELEGYCLEHFEKCLIVRLPGLFGKGLKKNVIYDLLNDNCLDMINVNSSIQYYYLKLLWLDISLALDKGIKLLNLFTAPLTTNEIVNNFFPEKKIGGKEVPAIFYDLKSKYDYLWGKKLGYIYDKEEVLRQLQEFVNDYRGLSK
jgi:hypothetical protein